MNKSFAVLLGALCLSSSVAFASEYGLCINRSGTDWRKQVLCEQAETRRLMREINNTYAKIARDPHFNKLNSGKTMLNDQFKQWQAYRNSYCAYWEAANAGYGDEAQFRARCLRMLTQKHFDDLNSLLSTASAVRE